jgi:hypothetical protein
MKHWQVRGGGSGDLLSKEAEGAFNKLGSRGSKAEEGMDIRGLIGCRGWRWAKAEIEWEAEGAANRGDTAYNVGTINRAAVPGVSCGVGGFNKYLIGTPVISGNANGFVEETMEVFDTNSFMLPREAT